MSKTKISEFSTTPGNNTDINGINIAEGCAPSGINNAIRELMSDLKEWQSGAMDVYVIPQGTAAAPGIQLYGDLDTGIYGYAANQLGVAVGGASAGYFSSAGWVGDVNGTITGDINATTIDTTNLEVTNIKAKDGTAAITIADSTGIVSVSTVLDLTTIEVTNIKAKDGTASASIADSTGVITVTKDVIVNGVTLGKGLGSVLTNTALGRSALAANTVGDLNTAVGNLSLTSNIGGTGNTAVGHVAMTSHQGGSLNTAVGAGSLTANLNGNNNTAIGQSALGTATGSNNTAVGSAAGSLITNGNKNTIIGNYDGNQGGLDIRTASNYIVLSDGDGNPRAYWNGANATFGGSLTATTITGTQVNSDNLRLDGNTLSSTDTNGNIIIAPNGTGQVQITNAALDLTTIEVTNIKAKDGTASITLADSTGQATFSANPLLNAGTANGVPYLNASKVLTTGSALTFDGSVLATTSNASIGASAVQTYANLKTLTVGGSQGGVLDFFASAVGVGNNRVAQLFAGTGGFLVFGTGPSDSISEQMRLTSTGLKSSIAGTNADPVFSYTSDTNTGIFFPAADKLGFVAGGGSDQMVLTSTGLGIGTNSPSATLHLLRSSGNTTQYIENSATNGYSLLQLKNTGASGRTYEIGVGGSAALAPYAGNLYFYDNTAATLRMLLDSSGNLGLGVAPSAWGGSGVQAFDVGTTGSFYGSSADVGVVSNAYYNGTNWIYKTGTVGTPLYASRYQALVGTGVQAWFTAPTGVAGGTISFTQAMTLDASGNLGVGATSPTGRVDAAMTSGSLTGYSLSLGGVEVGSLKGNSTTGEIRIGGTYTNYFPTFYSSGTERARILSGGEVLIGATALGSYFDGKFNVAGRIHTKIGNAADSNHVVWNEATSGDNGFVIFGTEATYTIRGSIDYNRAGGLTRYNTTSDYRAKDIIGPVQNPGATIDALKVYEGVMKGATQSRPMLVAHEAQEHAPYAVSGVKDEVNEDGTPKFQQMDVSSLVPLLLAEIQSLRARVAALESN